MLLKTSSPFTARLPASFTAGLRTLTLIGAAAALAACTNLSGLGASSEFQCKAPEGIPCQSISGVHHNERAGNLPAQRASRGDSLGSAAPATAGTGKPASMDTTEGGAPGATAAAAPGVPLYRKASVAAPERIGPGGFGAIRSDPTVIRIWVAPWEDADGDLNDQSYVYMQVDAGRWLIEHNRAQIRREFAPREGQALVAPRGSLVAPSPSSAGVPAHQTPHTTAPLPLPAGQGAPGGTGARMQLPPELAEALRRAAERGAAMGANGPGGSPAGAVKPEGGAK
jgi:conjugal transfer pilus assembly protein TraV